jgi:hypothetical protein
MDIINRDWNVLKTSDDGIWKTGRGQRRSRMYLSIRHLKNQHPVFEDDL